MIAGHGGRGDGEISIIALVDIYLTDVASSTISASVARTRRSPLFSFARHKAAPRKSDKGTIRCRSSGDEGGARTSYSPDFSHRWLLLHLLLLWLLTPVLRRRLLLRRSRGSDQSRRFASGCFQRSRGQKGGSS